MPIKSAQVPLKKCNRDFQNSPAFERSACFYVTISGNFERFQYFNFETEFLKTAISETNVKTNRMVSTKWTENGVLPVTSLLF